ncbi:MAG: hypothetical protein L3J72_03725 [Thermoplasmata archaeon]|nr:hypothetical protein [Thermoplasmata archaeon]
MVLREDKVKVGPLAVPEGEAQSTRCRVQMKGVVVGVKERLAAVGDRARYALAEPPSVCPDEGKGRVGGSAGVGAEHVVLTSDLLTEWGERAAGGKRLLERLANAPVDQETIVLEEGKKGSS